MCWHAARLGLNKSASTETQRHDGTGGCVTSNERAESHARCPEEAAFQTTASRVLPARFMFPPTAGTATRFEATGGNGHLVDRRTITCVDDLAATIRYRRAELRLTQSELAARSGTGRRFVADIESGHPRAETGKVLAVLTALGLELSTEQSNG